MSCQHLSRGVGILVARNNILAGHSQRVGVADVHLWIMCLDNSLFALYLNGNCASIIKAAVVFLNLNDLLILNRWWRIGGHSNSNTSIVCCNDHWICDVFETCLVCLIFNYHGRLLPYLRMDSFCGVWIIVGYSRVLLVLFAQNRAERIVGFYLDVPIVELVWI